MAAVIDKLANSGLGWFNDIFQLRVFFDADLVDPHQVAAATPPNDDDEDDAVYTSEVPLFVAGAAVQGFIRVIAPPGRTVSHNGISIMLRSTLVSADEDISSELREEEMDVVPEGKIAGTVDMPFVFPGVLTSSLATSYEGTLFSVRHVVVVTVARPWYTFEVSRTAGFGIQRLFDIPTRCSYVLELSSDGETTETVAADAAGDTSPTMTPPLSQRGPGYSGDASRTGASKTGSASPLAGSPTAVPAPASPVPSSFDSQLALYGPQQAAIVDMDDGSVVDFKFDKGCYEQAEALSGSLTFSGVTQPIVLVRLAVLRVEYCNGETEDEVVFDETILDARRWRARKEHAAALAGIPPAKGGRSEGRHRRPGRRSGRVASSRRGAGAGASSGSEEEEDHEGEGDEDGEAAEEMAAEGPAHAAKRGGRGHSDAEEEEMLDAADEEGDGSTLRHSASGGSYRGSRGGGDEGDGVEGRGSSRRSTAASSLSRGVAASSSSSRSAAVVPLSRGDRDGEDEAVVSAPVSPSLRGNGGGSSADPASPLRSPLADGGGGNVSGPGGRKGKPASAAAGAAAEAAQLKEFEDGEPSAATLRKGRAKAKARVAAAARARRDNADRELEDEAEGAADVGGDEEGEEEGEEGEGDEDAWFPSPEDMEGPYGDGSEVDPDLPVVGDVSLAVELDFAQIPGVCPTLSLKLASAEEGSAHKPRPTEGSFAVAPRQVSASSKRLSAHDPSLQEDVSVRFFLRLTVYTQFHPAAKRWVSREVVIFRERLHGTPILPHLRAQPHFLFSPTAAAGGRGAAGGKAGVPGSGRPAALARGLSAGRVQPLESPSGGGAAAGAGTGVEGATSPKLQPLAQPAALLSGSPRLGPTAAPAAAARSAASRGGGGKPSPAVSPLAEGTGPSPRGRVPSAPLADGDLDEMEGGLGAGSASPSTDAPGASTAGAVPAVSAGAS